MRAAETPYLHVREKEGSLLPLIVEIFGNRCALLQLRAQIDRALKDEECPLDEAIYRELGEEEYEVVVRRARSREEMRPPVPRPEKKTLERLPWAEVALTQETARREQERREQRKRG